MTFPFFEQSFYYFLIDSSSLPEKRDSSLMI